METECAVCMEGYEPEGDKRPKLLPCSHTFCLQCLGTILSVGGVRCPECREVHSAPDGVEAFPTNRYILAPLEQLEEERRKAREEAIAKENPYLVTAVLESSQAEIERVRQEGRAELREMEAELRRKNEELEEERRRARDGPTQKRNQDPVTPPQRPEVLVLRVPPARPDGRIVINVEPEVQPEVRVQGQPEVEEEVPRRCARVRKCCDWWVWEVLALVLLHIDGFILGFPFSIVCVFVILCTMIVCLFLVTARVTWFFLGDLRSLVRFVSFWKKRAKSE